MLGGCFSAYVTDVVQTENGYVIIYSDGTQKVVALALRLQCICMPLLPLNFMASVTYQSVGSKAIAALLSVSRQGLFYIPAVLTLPKLLGLIGVQSCQALSDLFAFFFAIPFTIMFLNTVKKEQKKVNEGGEE